MPAPQAAQLEAIAAVALQSAGIRGRNAKGLGKALAQAAADALAMFFAQAMVSPGIAATAPPPPGSGSTMGPGNLLPPPAGGPLPPQLEGPALGALSANGIKGRNARDLSRVMALALAQGIMMFTAQAKVGPGIAVAGYATKAPGNLI